MKQIVGAVVAVGIAGTIAICAFLMGHEAGVYHAIADSEVYLPDGYIETVADEGFTLVDVASNFYWDSFVDNTTCQVQIVLDNNVYVHNARMGR